MKSLGIELKILLVSDTTVDQMHLPDVPWFSPIMFLWMMPIPPSLAIAIAISYSVTVSIAAETMGNLSGTFREKRDCKSVR